MIASFSQIFTEISQISKPGLVYESGSRRIFFDRMALIYLWTKVGMTLLFSRIRLVKSGFKETLVSFTRPAIYQSTRVLSPQENWSEKKNPPRQAHLLSTIERSLKKKKNPAKNISRKPPINFSLDFVLAKKARRFLELDHFPSSCLIRHRFS